MKPITANDLALARQMINDNHFIQSNKEADIMHEFVRFITCLEGIRTIAMTCEDARDGLMAIGELLDIDFKVK